MSTKLKRCPFCGSLPTWDKSIALGTVFHYLRCGGAMGVINPTKDMAVCQVQPRTPGFLSKEEAIDCWNKRFEDGK